jgi:hypothetical protein
MLGLIDQEDNQIAIQVRVLCAVCCVCLLCVLACAFAECHAGPHRPGGQPNRHLGACAVCCVLSVFAGPQDQGEN